MDNRNLQQPNENGENSKAKTVWKNIGIFVLALALSVITVLVINLNR